MHLGIKIKKHVFLEIIKWISIILLLMLLIVVSYVYHNNDTYIKNIVMCIIMFLSTCIMFTTRLGKMITIFGKEAYLELQKVVWPTYQDSFNTTLVVIAVTIVISLILWGLDTVLVHLISFGLRL